MTTSHSAAAGTARQRLASVLATLQQDPNVPASVLEILSGLAKAMGPLFQLERGSPDTQLFVEARTVLQATLERIQTVDQTYPGVSDATGAIAQCLGIIFTAMKAAGLVGSPSGAPPAAAVAQAPAAAPVAAFAATAMAPQQPVMQQPPFAQPAPVAAVPRPQAAAPVAPQQQAPVAKPAPAAQKPAAHAPAAAPKGGTGKHGAEPTASVPIGPNGMPRLEGEIGVHSETNFFTDFLGDIRNHGGIFVATFHILPLGSQCEVILTFPGSLTAEIRGVVRWKRETNDSSGSSPGLGIEITNANAESWNLIDRFMRKREPIMHEM